MGSLSLYAVESNAGGLGHCRRETPFQEYIRFFGVISRCKISESAVVYNRNDPWTAGKPI